MVLGKAVHALHLFELTMGTLVVESSPKVGDWLLLCYSNAIQCAHCVLESCISVSAAFGPHEQLL